VILAITNEDRRLRAESKLGGIVRTKEWPTFTAKDFKKLIIR
jgi:hypothetical protein